MQKVLLQAGLGTSSSFRNALRACYRAILDDYGQVYEGRYHKWLKKHAILWVAIIQQAEEFRRVSDPYDGLCHLEEGGLNWSGISDTARKLAIPDLCELYSKQGCIELIRGNKSDQQLTESILYQCKWDHLRGCSSLSLRFPCRKY